MTDDNIGHIFIAYIAFYLPSVLVGKCRIAKKCRIECRNKCSIIHFKALKKCYSMSILLLYIIIYYIFFYQEFYKNV